MIQNKKSSVSPAKQRNNSIAPKRLGPLSLGLVASFILTGSSVADGPISTDTQLSSVPGAQATAISQAISQSVNSFSDDNLLAFDGLLLAQATTHTTTPTASTDSMQALTQARFDELMAVDNRDVDGIAARLKEIIKARHRAENRSLESIYTIAELQAQLVELEALLQNTNTQKQALSMDQSALQEKLDQITLERDTAQQALLAETQNTGEELNSSQSTIAGLTDQLDALTAKYQQTLTHADDLTEQLLQNQNALDELTVSYNDVSSERDNLLSTNGILSNDVASLENTLGELQTQLNTVAANRTKAEQNIAELQAQIDGKENTLATKLTDLVDKENLLDNLKMQLQQVAEEKDNSINKVAELDANLTDKANYQAELETRLAGLESDKEEAQHEIKLLEDRLADSTQQQLQNQAALDELTVSYNDVFSERDNLLSANNTLSNDVASLENNLGELQTQLNTVAENRAKAEQSVAELQAQIDGKENTLTAKLTDLVDKENLLESLRMQLQQVAEEKDNSISKVAELDADLTARAYYQTDLEAKLVGLESDKEDAQQEIKLLEEGLANATEQQLQNKAALDELTVSYNDLSSERDNLLSANNTLSNDVASLENNLRELQTQIDGKETMLSAKLTDLAGKENLLDNLRMQLQQVAEEKDNSTSKVAELDADLTEKANYQVELEAKLAGLESDKEEAQHEIKLLEDKLVDSENTAGEALTANIDLSDNLSLLKDNVEDTGLALITEQQEHAQTRIAFDAEASQLRAEIDSLITERDALQLEKDTLSAKSGELLDTKVAMQRNLDIHKLNWKSAVDSTVKLKDQVGILSADRDEAADRIQSLEDELNALNNELNAGITEHKSTLANKNQNFATQKAKLQATVKEQQGKLDELASTEAQQDKDIQNLTNKITKLTTENQKRNDSALAKILEKDKKIAKLGEQITALESKSEQLNKLNRDGGVKLNKITSRVQELLKGKDTSDTQLARLKTINNELSDEIESLKQQFETSTTDRDQIIANLRSEIEQLLATQTEIENREATALQLVGDLTTARDVAEAERAHISAEAEELRLSLTEELNSANLQEASVQSARPDNSIPIRLGNADYFSQGSSRLTREGAANLTKLARIIKNFDGRRIVVEGHTDTVPIGPDLKSRFASNWELSVARAATAVRHMQIQANIDPRQINAAGFGQYQPVASNDTDEGRQQNRRVEVVLYPIHDQYETISSIDE